MVRFEFVLLAGFLRLLRFEFVVLTVVVAYQVAEDQEIAMVEGERMEGRLQLKEGEKTLVVDVVEAEDEDEEGATTNGVIVVE